MPQIVEIVGIGPVEFPDGMSKEQMAEALKKLPKPNAPKLGSNIINTDVPTVVSQTPQPEVKEEPKRSMMDRVKALYEVPLTVGSAMVAGPVSSAYGVYKSATSPEFGTPQGTQVGQQAATDLSRRMTYTPTSPVSQEILQDVGQTMEAAKLPPLIPTTGMIPSYARMAQSGVPAVRQNVVQPVMQTAQTIPQTVRTAPQKVANLLRREPSEVEMRIANAPSAEDLAASSTQLFKQAKESNVQLNARDFANTMKTISSELREEGYDPRSYPKLDVAFSQLQNAKMPKDFNELKTLRKFIQGAQKSNDLEEKRLATILKDRFDDYVLNIPESSVKAGDKQGLQAWKEARDVYSRMSKAEIFDDMLETAELTKGKFSQSGLENALYNELKKLATNEKRMRLFTQEEQEAIKQAVRGSNMQNVLRIFGKFAPTSSVSSILPLLTTAASAPLGLTLTAGAVGSRVAATKMRKQDVKKLAALMRAGAKKEEQK
jgi:hypothetical protein